MRVVDQGLGRKHHPVFTRTRESYIQRLDDPCSAAQVVGFEEPNQVEAFELDAPILNCALLGRCGNDGEMTQDTANNLCN